MAKAPVYVSCAKCGYRGTNQRHECTRPIAGVGQMIASSAPAPRRNIDDVPQPVIDLSAMTLEHRRLFGRPITYVEILVEAGVQHTGMFDIEQRCSACRADVKKRVTVDLTSPLVGLELGAAARKSYLLHRCDPVEASLMGFTYEELEELHQELERDAFKMIDRAADVSRLKNARPR